MEKEIYLTADLTDAVPAPRFAWYNPETDEKEPIYYPEDPEDPELELLDNEGEISYEDVSVLACPFCRRVLRFSEIAVLPEETEEALLPYYGDGWKDVALLHDIPYTFVSRCPGCGHAWHVSNETLTPVSNGKTGAILESFRIETGSSSVTVHAGAVIPVLTLESLQIQAQTYQLRFDTVSGEATEMTPAGQKTITYETPWQILEDAFQDPARLQETAAAIAGVTGTQPPQLQTLQQLCTWNRFRWADAKTVADLTGIRDAASYFAGIAPDEPRETVLQKLIAGLGIHDCKTTRRALTEDIGCIQDARVFAKLGFTTMDSFRRMLEEKKLRCYADMHLEDPALHRFMQDLIARKSEAAALRSVMELQDAATLRDTAAYYVRGLEQLPEADCLRLLHGTISEIHDRLLEHVRISERPNEVISYTSGQRKYLEHDIGGVSFRLAADTDELYEVGGKMHNCVATYCDAALRGESLIVIGREADGTPVLCIELTSRLNLVQLKGIRNAIPRGRLAAAALEWTDRADIRTGSCEDFAALFRAAE